MSRDDELRESLLGDNDRVDEEFGGNVDGVRDLVWGVLVTIYLI